MKKKENYLMEKKQFSNNLFQFATGELSQDAMICWLCNNYNVESNDNKTKKLKELARKIILYFLNDKSIEIEGEIDIVRQVHTYEVDGKRKGKIDILIIVNKQYAIIIEDKTYTSESGGQIEFYRKAIENGYYSIKKELTNFYKELPVINFKKENIKTVYLKTGFHYPIDCNVEVNLNINGEMWLGFLKEYERVSDILDDYIVKLQKDLDWYKNIDIKFDQNLVEDVLSTYYGQYRLISEMFDKILDKSFAHGSSAGIPWTNNTMEKVPYIVDDKNPNLKGRKFRIFCRIDKYNHRRNKIAYCASIRQYDREISKERGKEGTADIDVKIKMFNDLRDRYEKAAEAIGILNRGYKKGGNNGGYFESEIGYFELGNGEGQIKMIEFPAIFKEFCKKLKNQDK
jgi:hypothetical protein